MRATAPTQVIPVLEGKGVIPYQSLGLRPQEGWAVNVPSTAGAGLRLFQSLLPKFVDDLCSRS